MLDYIANKEAIERVREIDDKINEEKSKDSIDGGKLTKLMYEQMLRGLYLNQYK